MIFESVDPYQWEFIDKTYKKVTYQFNDMENNRYLVEFKNKTYIRNEIEYELTYYVYNDDHYSVTKIVNVNPYKILSTVFGDILKDFLSKVYVDKVYMVGVSKDRERSFISKRTNMYLRYLQRNPINGFSIGQSGNTISLNKI
jgi:hypothetical protein